MDKGTTQHTVLWCGIALASVFILLLIARKGKAPSPGVFFFEATKLLGVSIATLTFLGMCGVLSFGVSDEYLYTSAGTALVMIILYGAHSFVKNLIAQWKTARQVKPDNQEPPK